MAWWVVVGHAIHLVGLHNYVTGVKVFDYFFKFLQFGNAAVSVFIILSGFVISHLLLTKKEDYRTYITRRFFRIYPIFIICILIAVILRPLYLDAYTAHSWVLGQEFRIERSLVEANQPLLHFLLHLTMLHGVFPDSVIPFSSSTFLAPAWSLSLEWQFYCIAPFLVLPLFMATTRKFIFLVIVLIIISILLQLSSIYWRYESFILLAFPLFVVGIASRFTLESSISKSRRIAIFIAIFLSVIFYSSFDISRWVAFGIWLVFYLFVRHESGFMRFHQKWSCVEKIFNFIKLLATNKLVSRFGIWSYSTYLIHIPVFSLVVGGVGMLKGESFSQNDAIMSVVLAMVIVLPISWLLYEYVEKPFISIGRKLTDKFNRV